MGWKDDLQDASFRGVLFECVSTKDAVSKSQAIHQAPYSNKALIEDMGKDPRKISIQAVYVGEDYKLWLDALEAALEATGEGELIHPIYGSCYASVLTYNIDHDAENFDACTISIDFILAKDQQRQLFIPVVAPLEIDGLSVIDSPFSRFKAVLQKLKDLDNNKFFQFINKIRSGLQTARSMLNLAKNAIEDLLDPQWLTGLIDDVTNLVTFDTNISAISKWRDIFHRVDRLTGLFDDEDSPELKQTWRATQIAIVISVSQKIVAQVRTETIKQTTNSDTANELSLTPVDLAVVRQNTRQAIQDAIKAEREETVLAYESIEQIQLLKSLSDQIHLQIQQLIEVRPPLSKTIVPVPCTVHWLAHYLYADKSRANEIRHLNPSLNNPALLLPGMELNTYAR